MNPTRYTDMAKRMKTAQAAPTAEVTQSKFKVTLVSSRPEPNINFFEDVDPPFVEYTNFKNARNNSPAFLGMESSLSDNKLDKMIVYHWKSKADHAAFFKEHKGLNDALTNKINQYNAVNKITKKRFTEESV